MARLNPVDPAHATGDTKELFDAVKASMGAVPNLTEALANSPTALRGWLAFQDALAAGDLQPALRERIAAGLRFTRAVLEHRGQVSDETSRRFAPPATARATSPRSSPMSRSTR